MIRRSTAIATAAILLSLLAHFIGLNLTWPSQREQAGDAAGTDVVAVGSTFEDIADPLSKPAPPEPAPVPEPPVEETPEPEPAETPTSEALVASANPQQTFAPDTGTAKVVQPDTAKSAEADDGKAPSPETAKPAGSSTGKNADAQTRQPVGSEAVTEAAEPTPVAPTEAKEIAATEAPQPTAPLSEPGAAQSLAALPVPAPEQSAVPVIQLDREVVEPEPVETTTEPVPPDTETTESEGSQLAVLTSRRPQLPSRRPPAELQVPGGTPDPGESLLAPSQLIESPLTAYLRDGTDLTVRQDGGARSGGSGFRESRGPGNSDVTNYAGRVLVHLNRAPPVRVSARGAARVFFVINPDGTLASVDVIDSTGSRDVNRAAKAQIRAGEPFPRPPQGTKRSLTFVYRTD